MSSSILFIHGFLGDAKDWDTLLYMIKPHLNGTCFELPGHGESPPIRPSDNDSTTRWFRPTAERLRIACNALSEPPVIVAYSMGARLALYTALYFRPAIAGIVLIGAQPGIETKIDRINRLEKDELLSEQLKTIRNSHAFRNWLLNWYQKPLFGDLISQQNFRILLQRRLKQRPALLAEAMHGLSVAVQPSLWPDLSKLAIPSLFIAGRKDIKYLSIAKQVAELELSWRIAICNKSAHAVHLQQPQWTVNQIKGFIADIAENSQRSHIAQEKEFI